MQLWRDILLGVFSLILFSRYLCGRAFKSWIVLEDIVLGDGIYTKEVAGFLPCGFLEENLCVLLLCCACLSFSDPIAYNYCDIMQII